MTLLLFYFLKISDNATKCNTINKIRKTVVCDDCFLSKNAKYTDKKLYWRGVLFVNIVGLSKEPL